LLGAAFVDADLGSALVVLPGALGFFVAIYLPPLV
jgi:hypothetical protein